MDYVIVRRCRRTGYELRDPFGGYVGCAESLLQVHRFADAAGMPIIIEPGAIPDTQNHLHGPAAWRAWFRGLGAMVRRSLAS